MKNNAVEIDPPELTFSEKHSRKFPLSLSKKNTIAIPWAIHFDLVLVCVQRKLEDERPIFTEEYFLFGVGKT